MEEHTYMLIRNANDNKFEFQWQQLFPSHIKYALDNNIEVVHFIVSPNVTFSDSEFIVPNFIKNTPQLNWKNTDNKTFISQNTKYKVIVFCTMMPTNDTRNSDMCNKFKKSFKSCTTCPDYYTMYKQTDYDISFTHTFYKNVEMLVSHINKYEGIVTCFSFAVFHVATYKRNIMNYIMFHEITEIFKKYPKNFLAEWTFLEENYLMSIFPNGFYVPLDTGISYVEVNSEFKEGFQIIVNLNISNKISLVRSIKLVH
jgi:hypothetical protein